MLDAIDGRRKGLGLLLCALAMPAVAIPLNDTGQVDCFGGPYEFSGTVSAATPNPTGLGYERQDCIVGRAAADAVGQMPKIGASTTKGRDYSKVCFDGTANCTDDANTAGYTALALSDSVVHGGWSCTQDNITGLTWALHIGNDSWDNAANPASITSDAHRANTARSNAGLCGYTDWRLPTDRELQSLVDYNTYGPAIDDAYFPGTASDYYWSSVSYVAFADFAWPVSFYGGRIFPDFKTNPYPVRLVRGAAAPAAAACPSLLDYTASQPNGTDRVVTDNDTGLMWKQCAEGQTAGNGSCADAPAAVVWADALLAANTSTYAGHSDWRLPNASELRSLVDTGCAHPAINAVAFPANGTDRYWSSTTSVDGPGQSSAWTIEFSFGSQTAEFKGSNNYGVRLVRGGQSLDSFASDILPTVTGVAPNAGPLAGGATATITGTNFVDGATVQFGANAATDVTVDGPTSITATIPAGSAGTVDVTVTTPGGTSPIIAADQYTYVPAPTVTAVSPSAGPLAGGATATITGTNFSGATAVMFGANAATNVTVDSPTSITATIPAGSAVGVVNVVVTTPGGASATSSADQYTYVAPPDLIFIDGFEAP